MEGNDATKLYHALVLEHSVGVYECDCCEANSSGGHYTPLVRSGATNLPCKSAVTRKYKRRRGYPTTVVENSASNNG